MNGDERQGEKMGSAKIYKGVAALRPLATLVRSGSGDEMKSHPAESGARGTAPIFYAPPIKWEGTGVGGKDTDYHRRTRTKFFTTHSTGSHTLAASAFIPLSRDYGATGRVWRRGERVLKYIRKFSPGVETLG